MRVALITTGFSTASPRGLDQHSVSLTVALQRIGVAVEVLAPANIPGLAPLAQRREICEGVGVTWINEGDQASDQDWLQSLASFLERERPDLVHFEWMVGDGQAIGDVLRAHGIASLYNAHDYAPLGEDARCLAADLVSYDPDDWEARARGLLVAALLAQHPALGKHDGTLIPSLVDGAFWSHVQNLLHGPEAPGLNEARDQVQRFRAQMADCFQKFGARLASSRGLASKLELLTESAVEVLEPGVDRSTFSALTPPRTGRGPVRFGFLGELSKAQGVHLLLDAFEGLDHRSELRIFGSSSDRLYLRTLRARAQDVGARWYGALEPGDRAQAMDRIDVLVVPAMWPQSAPHEVREALAARRPVIVCDFEATAQGIYHEQNGLHFVAGDLGALRAALLRFVEEPDLLTKLELAIRAPRDISEEARDWAQVYDGLLAATPVPSLAEAAPSHLQDLAKRYQELQGLSTRELFDKVTRGLQGLATRMGVRLDPAQALAGAVSCGGHSRDGRMSHERVHQWLEVNARELKKGRDLLVEQELQMRKGQQELQERQAMLESQWHDQVEGHSEVQEQLETVRAERDRALRRLKKLETDTHLRMAEQTKLHSEVVLQEASLRQQLGGIAKGLLTPAEAVDPEPESVQGLLERLQVVIKRNQEEMAWRRGEMAKAKGAASGFLARLIGGEASALMADWDEIPTPPRSASTSVAGSESEALQVPRLRLNTNPGASVQGAPQEVTTGTAKEEHARAGVPPAGPMPFRLGTKLQPGSDSAAPIIYSEGVPQTIQPDQPDSEMEVPS